MRNTLPLKYLLCTIIGASDFLIPTYGSAVDSEIYDVLRVPRQVRRPYSESCELPAYPQFGKWAILGGAKGSPGETVSPYIVLKFECNDGYKLSHNNSAYTFCEAGRWVPNEKPKCLRTCPPLKSTATTTIKCRDKDGIDVECDGTTNGASAVSTCAPFYEPGDRGIGVCVDGSWNLPPVFCQPVCGEKKIHPVPLILSGQTPKEGSYPWAAVIYQKINDDFVYVCAGSILSQRIIVTAAHCVTNHHADPLPKETIAVGVGNYYNKYNDARDVAAKYSQVEEIIVPTLYRGEVQRYASDIAVIVVPEGTLLLSRNVQPVCYNHLPTIDLKNGSIGSIAGYRFPRPDEKGVPEELYELHAVFKPAEVCFQELPKDWVNKYYTFDKMCAGYTTKPNCINSGGGLAFKNSQDGRYYIHGILSVGMSKQGRCSDDVPPLYTKVAAHYEWLEKIIAQYTTV